jgi:four helix bundle protein
VYRAKRYPRPKVEAVFDMKTTDIITLQAKYPSAIVFVRDRIFWQCWESSAYLFTEFVRKYQVHHRHFKNLAMDLVWLGFPLATLDGVVKNLLTRGCKVMQDTTEFVVVATPWQVEGVASWKALQIEKCSLQIAKKQELVQVEQASDPRGKAFDFLPVYRITYDLTLEVYKLSANLTKVYKFSLGERLRQSMTDLLATVHLAVSKRQKQAGSPSALALTSLDETRLYLRMLKDLHQLNMERFARINLVLESIHGQLHAMEAI